MTICRSATSIYHAYLRREQHVSGGAVAPNWLSDGNGLWYVERAPEDTAIVKVDLSTGAKAAVFNVAAVRAALTAATGHEPPYRGLPFDNFTPAENGCVEFSYAGEKWRFDPAAGSVQRRESAEFFMQTLGWTADVDRTRMWRRVDYLSLTSEVPEQLSPNGDWFASVREYNIVLRAAASSGGREHILTHDGDADSFWDIEAPRLRELPGRRVGLRSVTSWSPDSLTLLAYRRNTAGVFRTPRVHWRAPFEEVRYLCRPKAGGKLDEVTAWFVDVRSRRQTPVRLMDVGDHYIQLIGWHPAGLEAILIIYTRNFRRLHIIAAHRETGAARVLMTESSTSFVKIWHTSILSGDHGFYLLPDGSGFLWLSTRNGWSHLYRYDMNGQILGQLTSGDWPVHEIAHVATDGFAYFTASTNTARPYDIHVCRVPLSNGIVEQLTHEKGVHTPIFAPSGRVFLDMHSAVDRPTRTELVKADGTRMQILSEMNISRLQEIGYVPAEEFTVSAADGTTSLWGVMYKPYDFERSGLYPVIEYIYGGPQTVEVPHFFPIDKTMMRSMNVPWALAQLGYIVVCLDARGTPGRSKEFQDAVYQHWDAGIADHVAAIRQLCEAHRWMDRNRVGIYGHSWGGYFATSALMQAPDVYYAAVSCSPAYDPWDSVLYEPYLDLPHAGRKVYEDADLVRQASKVRRPLMILIGTSDNNFTSSMKMTRALIEAGVDHELVVVPDAFHHFSGVEEDYLLMKLVGWFERHIKKRRVDA